MLEEDCPIFLLKWRVDSYDKSTMAQVVCAQETVELTTGEAACLDRVRQMCDQSAKRLIQHLKGCVRFDGAALLQ